MLGNGRIGSGSIALIAVVALAAASLVFALAFARGVGVVAAAPSPSVSTASVQGSDSQILTGAYSKRIVERYSFDDNAAAVHVKHEYELELSDEYPLAVEGEVSSNA